jgi:hypothetical protein
MNAPLLPLTAANLNSLHSVGVLRGWMMFPDDEVCRSKIIAHYVMLDFLSGLDREAPTTTLPTEYLMHVVASSSGAANKEEIKEWAKVHEPYAVGAGGVIWISIPGVMRGHRRAVTDATKQVGSVIRMVMEKGGPATASKDFDNKRKPYKPVAALWAVVHEFANSKGPSYLPRHFPCDPEDVAEFLSISELFREWCESNKAVGQAETIIPVGTHVRCPEEVLAILPRCEFSILEKVGND